MKLSKSFVFATVMMTVAILFWIYNAVSSPGGNFFSGSLPSQLIHYGRLAGLFAALMLFFQMLTNGRGRRLEKAFLKSKLMQWHRHGGWLVLGLILLHAGLVTAGNALQLEESPLKTFQIYLTEGSVFSLAAAALLLLFAALGATWLWMRKKISYPGWKRTHLWMGVVFLLAIAHPFYGYDAATNRFFMIFWALLTFAVLLEYGSWKIGSRFSVPAHAG